MVGMYYHYTMPALRRQHTAAPPRAKKTPGWYACSRGPQEGDACPFGCLVAREISKSLRCGEESREV